MINKFCVLILLLLSVLSAQSQDSKEPLRNVLGTLEKQHQVTFSYSDDVVNRLTVSTSEESELNFQLSEIVDQTGLHFEQVSSDIILIKTEENNFCARILDSRSGQPLEGAQVVINGTPTNNLSDAEGFSKFRESLTFQDTVQFIYFGYDHANILAEKIVGSECQDVILKFGKTTLDEVIITNYISSGINASQEDHSLKIKSEDLALLPGETDGDILLAIKTLPGITTPSGKAGNLHIRGSTTDQTLVLFDNIPIYHKGHYFGAVSPYNPRVVDQVTVYRSGFGANLGGRVGGAIELESNKGIPEKSSYQASVNTYYASAFAEVPIGEKFSMSASGRSSFPFDWDSPKLDALAELALQSSRSYRAETNANQEVLKNDFNFSDFNVNGVYKLPHGKISGSVLGINNLQEDEIYDNNRNSLGTSEIDLSNYGGNLEWKQSWNANFYTKSAFTYSEYDYYSLIQENPENMPSFIPDQFETEIVDIAINAEGNLLLNIEKDSRIGFGYQMNRHKVTNSSYTERTNPPRSNKSVDHGYLHSVFVDHKTLLEEKLSINWGLRSNYFTLSEDFRIEPRLFVNYEINNKLSLKGSSGLYSQFITQNVFFDFEDTKVENLEWQLASDERPFVRSSQYMIGGLWKPGNFLFDLEVYYKDIEDLSTIGPNRNEINGTLEIYGVDFLLKKSWGKLDTWVSYSYTSTEMDFPDLNQLTFEAYYDQPHALNINATMPYKQWKFSIGWQYLSGVPVYTDNTFFPTPGPASGPPPMGPRIVPAEENDGRFPSQHQLDASIVYLFPKESNGWSGSIGLSLLNIYDRDNLVASNYITLGPNTALEERYAIGFAPNLTLTVKW